MLHEISDNLYPSQLFPISTLNLPDKQLRNSTNSFRYLGLTLCEAIGFMYTEIILREINFEKLCNLVKIPGDEIFTQVRKTNATTSPFNEEKILEYKNSFLKFINLLEKSIEIMTKNNKSSFYEIIYNYYAACSEDDHLKIGSKLFVKNLGFQALKRKASFDREKKKFVFFELFSNNLYEKDLSFLAETLGIHIQTYHLDSKDNISNFSYKEKYCCEKPFPVKILQRDGKFYGLYSSEQKIELDNLFFENNKNNQDLLFNNNNLTLIVKPIKKNSILEESKENKKITTNTSNNTQLITEEKKEIMKTKIKCCICFLEIESSNFFKNPACNHIYCYQCIIDKCEKKHFFNLCFERICTKSLALTQLEKFLLEMSMLQTNDVPEMNGIIEYEQECFHCGKKDKTYFESFMHFEYYKCFHCQKFSCIIHKNHMENCFCFCLKCYEQTDYYDGYTRKRCINCKEIYCLICKKFYKSCRCYCKVCGSPENVQNEKCEICSKNCSVCNLNYGEKLLLIKKRENENNFICRSCLYIQTSINEK